MNRKYLPDSREGSLSRYQAPEEPLIPADNRSTPPGENPGLAIWRRRWSVLLVTLIFAGMAVVYLRFAKKYYTTQTRLSIEAPVTPVPTMSPVDGGIGSGETFLARQVTFIQSPPVLNEAAKLVLGPGASEADIQEKAGYLSGGLSVDVGKKDEVITIAFDSRSAEDAARCDKAIADAYINWVMQARSGSKAAMATALRAEKVKYDEQLAAKRRAISNFLKDHPDISFKSERGSNILRDKLASLSQELTKAQLATIDAAATVATAEASRSEPSKLLRMAMNQKYGGTAEIGTALAGLRKQLDDSELQLGMLQGKFPSGHPTVVANVAYVAQLKANIASKEKQLAEEYLAAVQQELDHAQSREQDIGKRLEDAKNAAIDVNTDEGRALEMDTDILSTSKLCDQLDTRIKELELSGDIQVPNIYVIEHPKVQPRPSKPAPLHVLALMILVGFVVGGGLALVRERMDGRVRSAEEISSILGLPVVGAVPHMKRNLSPLARAQAAHWDPLSEVSEAYRAVRTAVHFGVQAGQAKTIVITSPAPGDGKSTLASNLAITMAQAGKRTLLLDADFRRPIQHRMFEAKEDLGLTSVLAGHETLSKTIRRTLVEGLDLLPAGPMPLNPSELLNGDSFADILEELTQQYDHVVLDCPPVMSVTDARILGAICDVTILVLRAGKTVRKAAELSRSGLLSVGARLIGVVVNDVPKGEQVYGYYGDYSYQPLDNRRRMTSNVDEESGNGSSGKRRRRLPSPSNAD